jgi:hypothetical protein
VLIEEDHKCILIIGGIEMFLPRIPFEARACVVYATTEGKQPETVIEEEKEKYIRCIP